MKAILYSYCLPFYLVSFSAPASHLGYCIMSSCHVLTPLTCDSFSTFPVFDNFDRFEACFVCKVPQLEICMMLFL